jgi:ubiquinone/menaquinone biosynthesis C-methylase UbiE
LLDVAIGDGVYLDWLPADWRIAGVDISRSQLEACRPRAAGRRVWLAQCEAEALPLADRRFDAVLSIGAFNYFNDPEVALREMVRVARPGAPIVISDEMPNLTDRMIGHKLGLPGLDRWIVSRLMHLGDPFTDMVEKYRDLDILSIARQVLPDAQFIPVWHGVGYVLVGRAPE